jgi:hypothetical protein
MKQFRSDLEIENEEASDDEKDHKLCRTLKSQPSLGSLTAQSISAIQAHKHPHADRRDDEHPLSLYPQRTRWPIQGCVAIED